MGHTGLLAETGKMVTRELLLSNLLATIVKFIQIYLIRKKLKDQKFLVTESLTSGHYNLLKEANEKNSVKDAWTCDDCILFKQNKRILFYKS